MERLVYYSGIGSRRSPPKSLERMQQLGTYLAENGFVLRSGGSAGADAAFELGCDSVNGKKEIYLPWKLFNTSLSKFSAPSIEALKIAEQHHDYWNSIAHGAKLLYARNVHIILGQNLKTPSNFVICWSNNSPGTMHSLSIARDHNIPIFNLINPDHIQKLNLFIPELLERMKND